LLHDLIVVGAGPVGATLALALADADLDILALDARPAGAPARGDRSLALSHGARLIFERLGVWPRLAADKRAITPITTIDISQAGGFGMTRIEAAEHDLPALGYVVSYRALQAALDAALTRSGVPVRFGATASQIGGTPAYASVTLIESPADPLTARLAAVADGSGATVAGIRRERRDYAQVALTAKVWLDHPHENRAFERFTAAGPMALLPEGDHYGAVWTMTPERGERTLALPDDEFLAALSAHFGTRVTGFVRVEDRRTFPLALEVARPIVATRAAVLGNAAQALHPVAGQGFNLGLRDAFELARIILDTPRDALGDRAMLDRYARVRMPDRLAGIAFTHGLLRLFGTDFPLVRWPRGVALTMLDALPPAKRVFTHAMMFGFH
jgi:2-octaprenyl-6-methoxyphenol hydroxylase